MQTSTTYQAPRHPSGMAQAPAFSHGDERQIGINDLEGGEYVRIVATTGIDTEEALEWAEDIIARKRRELTRLRERRSTVGRQSESGDGQGEDNA